jgi:hypothetical protein
MSHRERQLISRRLLLELDKTAREFKKRGIKLFIFGSIAETYPASFRGADLDLGYELSTEDQASEALEHELAKSIGELPTIRPIDLVNFSKAGHRFKTTASRKIIKLPVGHE